MIVEEQRRKPMVVPVIHIYNDDIQVNGNIRESAIQRECMLVDIDPPLNSRLLSELYYVSPFQEDESTKKISIRVEDTDVVQVLFVNDVYNKQHDPEQTNQT